MPDHKPICRRRFVKKRRAIGKCSVAQNLLCHLQQRCAPRHPSNRRNAQRMSYPSSAVRKIRAFQFLKQPVDLPLPEHFGNDRESAFPRCFHPAQFVSLLPPITRIIHANLRSRQRRAPLCVLYVDYVFLLSYPSTRRVESLRFREVTSPGRSLRKSCRKNTCETPSRTAHSKPLTEKITASESTLTKKRGVGVAAGLSLTSLPPYFFTSILAARSAFTAAPRIPISSEVGTTSNRLPCSGLIFTISCTSRSSNPASMNFVSGPVMKNVPGPSMWMLVAVAAASARWHNCTNSAHRASPARAFSNTSSGSKSRNRMRIDRRPRIPSRCPLPPQPQKLSFASSVTTECPPSHTPSLAGYRPHPTPFPSVHTRATHS